MLAWRDLSYSERIKHLSGCTEAWAVLRWIFMDFLEGGKRISRNSVPLRKV